PPPPPQKKIKSDGGKMSTFKEMTIHSTFKEALRFFQDKSEGRFQSRSVKIPGIERGHVSRLKVNFESSNANPSLTDLPIGQNGKKNNERVVIHYKSSGRKVTATEFSKNVAKFLHFRKAPSRCLPKHYSSYLKNELIEEDLMIARDAAEKMRNAIFDVRRCSVSTMATNDFGAPDEDQASSTEDWSPDEALENYFQTRDSDLQQDSSFSDVDESFNCLSDEDDSMESVDRPSSAGHWASLL
ncbi:MAG: hypothetical protein ABJR55_12485, partial [Alphaproteobacteria bacterium]